MVGEMSKICIGQNPMGVRPPKRPLGVKSLNDKPIVINDENDSAPLGALPKVITVRVKL